MRGGLQFGVDETAEMVGVIGGIGDDMADAFEPFREAPRLRAVAPLAGRNDEADRIAKGIDDGMDLAGQAAARTADRVSRRPPF